jgi:hypothetical protein
MAEMGSEIAALHTDISDDSTKNRKLASNAEEFIALKKNSPTDYGSCRRNSRTDRRVREDWSGAKLQECRRKNRRRDTTTSRGDIKDK